jgi:hypothetical protein
MPSLVGGRIRGSAELAPAQVPRRQVGWRLCLGEFRQIPEVLAGGGDGHGRAAWPSSAAWSAPVPGSTEASAMASGQPWRSSCHEDDALEMDLIC